MQFTIKFNDTAYKQFCSLPKKIKDNVNTAIQKKLIVDPIHFGKPLRYDLNGFRSLRVGDYRIVYEVKEREIMVLVIKVGIRRDVYD